MHKPPQAFTHSSALLRYIKHDHSVPAVPSSLRTGKPRGPCLFKNQGTPTRLGYLGVFLPIFADKSYVSFDDQATESGLCLKRELIPLFPHDMRKGLKRIRCDHGNGEDTGDADSGKNGLSDVLLPFASFRSFFHLTHIPNHKLSLRNGNI